MLIEALSHVDKSETKCEANCAEAVKLAIHKAGLNDVFFDVSCTRTRANLTKSTEWKLVHDRPQRNDVILFDWDRSGDCDHIGIVRSCDGDYIYYDDFNGGNEYRSYHTNRQIPVNTNLISAIFRHWITEETKPTTYIEKDVDVHFGDKGALVKLIQVIVGVTTDGMYGKDTKKAVENFQSTHNCECDGIVGTETFTAMSEHIKRFIGGI